MHVSEECLYPWRDVSWDRRCWTHRDLSCWSMLWGHYRLMVLTRCSSPSLLTKKTWWVLSLIRTCFHWFCKHFVKWNSYAGARVCVCVKIWFTAFGLRSWHTGNSFVLVPGSIGHPNEQIKSSHHTEGKRFEPSGELVYQWWLSGHGDSHRRGVQRRNLQGNCYHGFFLCEKGWEWVPEFWSTLSGCFVQSLVFPVFEQVPHTRGIQCKMCFHISDHEHLHSVGEVQYSAGQQFSASLRQGTGSSWLCEQKFRMAQICWCVKIFSPRSDYWFAFSQRYEWISPILKNVQQIEQERHWRFQVCRITVVSACLTVSRQTALFHPGKLRKSLWRSRLTIPATCTQMECGFNCLARSVSDWNGCQSRTDQVLKTPRLAGVRNQFCARACFRPFPDRIFSPVFFTHVDDVQVF